MFVMLIGGQVLTSSCSQKVCPANDRPVFQKKRARYAMMNHMKRKAGKGDKKSRSKKREPKYKFFQTRFKKKQFKHQTK